MINRENVENMKNRNTKYVLKSKKLVNNQWDAVSKCSGTASNKDG